MIDSKARRWISVQPGVYRTAVIDSASSILHPTKRAVMCFNPRFNVDRFADIKHIIRVFGLSIIQNHIHTLLALSK